MDYSVKYEFCMSMAFNLLLSSVVKVLSINKGHVMDNNIIKGKWHILCEADGCDMEARTAGLCPRHYQQVRRHGRLTPEREYGKRGECCLVGDCREEQVAKGYCFRHYQQVRRYGRLTPERERVYGRKVCDVPGCQERHSSRGFCKKHYMSEYYLPKLAEKDLRRTA